MRRRLVLACATFGLVVGLGWPASAFAHDGPPGSYGPHGAEISLSTSVTYPGGCLTVKGREFASHESITLTFYSHGVFLGSTTTNGNGSFSKYVCIPSNAKLGEHTIVAKGSTGDSDSAGITVAKKHHHENHDGDDGHGGHDNDHDSD